MIRLTLTLHPALWLTANQRLHWSTRMRRTRMLRAYAASEARIHGLAGRPGTPRPRHQQIAQGHP